MDFGAVVDALIGKGEKDMHGMSHFMPEAHPSDREDQHGDHITLAKDYLKMAYGTLEKAGLDAKKELSNFLNDVDIKGEKTEEEVEESPEEEAGESADEEKAEDEEQGSMHNDGHELEEMNPKDDANKMAKKTIIIAALKKKKGMA